MTSKWPIARIADCAASEPYSTQIGPFGDKIKATSYVAKGAPVLRGTNLSRHARFHDTDFVYVREELVSTEFAKFICEAGDVILCHKGTLGEIGIIPRQTKHSKYVMGNSMMKVRCNLDILEPLYLYYWLSSKDGQDYLFSRVSQVGVPQIQTPLTTLRQAEFPLPPLIEQKRIANILGSLDDKIELNRKMNETLEQMAKTLFKSWFVDFDPVHAKAAFRQPVGMDKATADLFPGSFVDSEMGKIPKGWEVADLGQIADITDCLHAKKPEASETGQLYLQLNNILDDGLIDISEAFLIGPEDYKKWTSRMEATEGDCVITNVGRVGAVAQIPQGMKAALGRNITGIRCKPIFTNPTFLIECLMSEAMREEIRKKTDTGTILDALNVKSIPKLRFIRPPSMIAERFERLARPLRHQMERGVSQSRTLANLRDTLLPKLLSGYPTKTSHK
jgi:type I restriction enzyme S subunit